MSVVMAGGGEPRAASIQPFTGPDCRRGAVAHFRVCSGRSVSIIDVIDVGTDDISGAGHVG